MTQRNQDCQTSMLVLPDDVDAHPLVASIDLASLCPNAEITVVPWKQAFSSEQLAELYDINVLGKQRINRAVLPQLRKQGQGLLIWISSSRAQGSSVPFLGAPLQPYGTGNRRRPVARQALVDRLDCLSGPS